MNFPVSDWDKFLSYCWFLCKTKQSWQCKYHLKKPLRKALQDTAAVAKTSQRFQVYKIV